MAKALFLSLPLHGHVNPSIGVVRELVRRGEDVVYFSSARFAPQVAETGCRFRPYSATLEADLALLPERTDEMAWRLMHMAAAILASDLESFRSERPDYLITDSVAPWGQWAARILRVPLVTSISTFAFNRDVLAFGLAGGVKPKGVRQAATKLRHLGSAWRLRRQLCRRYQVRGPGVFASVMGHSELNIVYTSRMFQPCAGTFDERFQFVGPILDRTEVTPFEWDRLGRDDLVYISLGTIFNTDASFFRRCIEAFDGRPVQLIVSIGRNVAPESLGTVPANVMVAREVPQLAVLQRARAFVTHGGMNSVSESLYYGVPMVVVPQMGEQAIVARQVELVGAGLRLGPSERTAQQLRDSIERVLADRKYRDGALAMSHSFKTAGGASRAADVILALAASASSAHRASG